MSKETYPKAEMDLILKNLSDRICSNHKEAKENFVELKDTLTAHESTHLKILDQVTYTNGKVKKIIAGLIALGAFTLGLGIQQGQWILKLFL
jgi:hypothetical protein